MKIYTQMDPKSHPKIDIWVIRGPTFEVFGSVLRNAIFDEFWDVQKVDQKWEKFDAWAALGALPRNFWEGRRVGRRSWEPGFISFGNKFWELGSTRLAPPSKDGVGGFKG